MPKDGRWMQRQVVKPSGSCHSAHSVSIQAAMTHLISITSSVRTTMLTMGVGSVDEVFITRQQLSKHMKGCKGLMTDDAKKKPTTGRMELLPLRVKKKEETLDQESVVPTRSGTPRHSHQQAPKQACTQAHAAVNTSRRKLLPPPQRSHTPVAKTWGEKRPLSHEHSSKKDQTHKSDKHKKTK